MQDQIIKMELVNWRELKPIQSDNFKKFSQNNMDKLVKSMEEFGFIRPFTVWEDNGTFWICDGKHREKTLEYMEKNGYEVPELLPAVFIKAQDKKQAAERLLALSSVFAEMTKSGLQEFIASYGLNVARITDLFGYDTDFKVDEVKKQFDNALKPKTEKTKAI